jgi:hypothetical protein
MSPGKALEFLTMFVALIGGFLDVRVLWSGCPVLMSIFRPSGLILLSLGRHKHLS